MAHRLPADAALAQDLRMLLREIAGRDPQPTAAIPESGDRAGYDGHKKRKGSKVHVAVDTLGHLLAPVVTPGNEQERAQAGAPAEAVQEATGARVELAFVDQGYTGDTPAEAAAEHGIRLGVVKLPSAKRGFVLLPRRWVVERSVAWAARFRRLAKGYERLANTLKGFQLLAFTILLLRRFVTLMAEYA